MACFRSGNCEGVVISGESWGGGVNACERHLSYVGKELLEKGDIDKSFLDDYIRIKTMLEAKEAVRGCMQRLANEMAQEGIVEPGNVDRTVHTKDGYVKLSAFLSRYEHLCWFPPCHHIFIGFVQPDNFLELIRQGILAKDPGAGPKHGDFTHRLQWHAISRVITNEFTEPKRKGWDHTPIELLSSFGSGWAKAAKAWAQIVESGRGFDYPDTFHAELQKDGYGILGVQISKRFNKRQAQQTQADQAMPHKEGESVKERYFRTTGQGVEINTARKVASKRYIQEQKFTEGNAPVMLNTSQAPKVKDTMPIGARIIMSRTSLRNDDGVFCENLGILDRNWAHPYEFL